MIDTLTPVASAYTAPDLMLIIGGLVTLVATMATAAVNVIIAIKTKATVDAVKTTSEAALLTSHETLAEAKVIVGHVNSAATAQTAKIAALQVDLDTFKALVADMRTTAQLLAQHTAAEKMVASSRGRTAPSLVVPLVEEAAVPAVPIVEIAKSIKNIDQSTKAIDKNTRKE